MQTTKIAVVGSGAIANVMHLPGIQTMQQMGLVELVAVCDVFAEKARATAERFGAPYHFTKVEDLLRQADFDLLVNTTVIPSHFEVTLAALEAGKHVYTQKPMSTSLAEATQLIEAARKHGVRLGVAPEHRVRPHIRKIAELVAQEAIGKISFARVQTSHHGPEKHKVDRDHTWFYKPGSDPIMDLGVHGLSMITSILGPVQRLTAFSGRSLPVRHILHGPLAGKRIDVEIDDNSLLLLDFGDARFAFLDATYCVPASMGPRLEIHGSEGTLAVTYVRKPGEPLQAILHRYDVEEEAWHEVAVEPPPPVLDLGTLHMVESIQAGRDHLLTAEHGRHMVEIITMTPMAAKEGRTVEMSTTFA
ncbi:MAG: Gfo/Idh/MocA family oxidoreductase [Caldilineaceae bacterium]